MREFYIFSFFLLGAVLGSFYNVLGLRIVNHESIVKPRSHCDKCGHVLKWYELIPILSFIKCPIVNDASTLSNLNKSSDIVARYDGL